jgi:hypothetical protein
MPAFPKEYEDGISGGGGMLGASPTKLAAAALGGTSTAQNNDTIRDASSQNTHQHSNMRERLLREQSSSISIDGQFLC